MNNKTTFCNCALPEIIGNTECCKNCENNPNRELTGYVDTTTKSDTIISNSEWISNITTLTKCPHCKKEFYFNGAVYCPYCGEELNPKPKKCECYHTQESKHYFTDYEKGFRAGMGLSHKEYEIRKEGRCWGTQEGEPCSCGGDEMKCDFYPEIRKQAKKGKKDMTNIERMIPKIAHLITCNSNEPFNELWKRYFSDEPIGFMPYEEVVEWLGKESEK